MEGCSSDGSSSFFTSKMPDEPRFPCRTISWGADGWVEELISSHFGLFNEKKLEISAIDCGLTESLTDQDQLNQVETSEASYQTRSGDGGRSKLTPAQKRENKRQSDCKYRQKRKITVDEQAAEIKHLREENKQLHAENRMIKKQKGLLLPNGQLPVVAPQRQHSYITQSTGKQLEEHQSLFAQIDADDESKVKLSDFTGLDGDRITVGKYSFPLSLHPTVKRIIDVHGDISATSKMNPSIAETIYIMFCASVKEMSDLQLEQVTEDRILKWRDAIKDGLRINFKVDFAMEHLKKIACAYIGLMERRKMENVAMRISKLEAELSVEKEEHAKICEQSKVYMDTAEEFNGKPVSSGLFQSLPTPEMCLLEPF